jgi:hypothetical protein
MHTHQTDVCLVDQRGLGVQKANMLSTARVIYMQGGVGGLYAGLQAGVVRQLTYGMPRMALFSMGLAHLAKSPDGSKVSFGTKLLLGSVCGGVAACIGVPTEVGLFSSPPHHPWRPAKNKTPQNDRGPGEPGPDGGRCARA